MIKLSEYKPPPHTIETIDLKVELSETRTVVTATIVGHGNNHSDEEDGLLKLNGESQNLISLELDGLVLNRSCFELNDGILTLDVPAERFELKVTSEINPSNNKALEGLYLSEGIFCTQCEPEGFRRITFFPDRPDILTIYTTTVIANKRDYPVLLSNGNLLDAGDLDDERHFMIWHDPFPKPSYLFALVGGKLDCLEDNFVTKSGRSVKLQIFVEPGNKQKCYFAMECVKKAMKWDEDRFDRLLRDGWIEVFRRRRKKFKTLYGLTFKTQRVISSIYKKLSGEEIPTDMSNNPIFAKNVKFSDKVYKKMIIEMNHAIRQQRRLSPE